VRVAVAFSGHRVISRGYACWHPDSHPEASPRASYIDCLGPKEQPHQCNSAVQLAAQPVNIAHDPDHPARWHLARSDH
jgi:hypothetical protein